MLLKTTLTDIIGRIVHNSTTRTRPTGEMPFEINGKPCIWLTWTGDNQLPAYLELCIETVQRWNQKDFNVILVTPDNLHCYVKSLHPAYSYLSYVHRSDYLRCVLLHEYGGIFLDVDTICFGNLSHWCEKLTRHDLIGYDGRPWNEVFGVGALGPARRRSILTSQWLLALERTLDRALPRLEDFRDLHPDEPLRDALGWSEILNEILTPLSKILRVRRELSFLPVQMPAFSTAVQLFTDAELVAEAPLSLDPRCEILVLNNSRYPESIRSMTREELRSSRVGLAQLLQRALLP